MKEESLIALFAVLELFLNDPLYSSMILQLLFVVIFKWKSWSELYRLEILKL